MSELIMSNGPPTDDYLIEDYKSSLEYLTTNDRYAINNLTVIAKENTEHAPTISKVLEEHIRNTPPHCKLPAIYVLDSIAKNIGTPYTLFLGHNLYATFMNAYCLVDSAVRKKLDEMLKTWKSPVPGSQEKRPVFPPEITKSIENALIQAKTLALKQQQQQARNQQDLLRRRYPTAAPSTPYQNTPTPPQNVARYPPPTQPFPSHESPPNGLIHAQTRSAYPQYLQTAPPQIHQYQQPNQTSSTPHNYFQPLMDIGSLHQDIERLILIAKADFANNIHDAAVQTRLKALLDLQSILKSQQIPPDQIQLIRDQVSQLSTTSRSAPPPTAFGYNPTPPAIVPSPHPQVSQPPQSSNMGPVLPSASTLADLLASAAKNQAVPPTLPQNPVIPQLHPNTQIPQSLPGTASLSSGTQISLIASLRAAGMLPPVGSTSSSTLPIAASTPFSYHQTPPVTNTPPMQLANLVRPPLTGVRYDIDLTSASLKIPRPHLISKLYEARPNQCSTCGKRFLTTEGDRNKKARHLDWHFRTNQRLAESAKRGQNRSWYVDEMEWIKSRGNEEDGIDVSALGLDGSKTLAAAAAVKNDPKTKFIPVPSDTALASAPCPICQEKFDTSWSDEVQDFVWMDAVQIGSRVYHASCHAEIKKDGATTPLRTSTPDSVLGKRKAEASNNSPSPMKMKREIAV